MPPGGDLPGPAPAPCCVSPQTTFRAYGRTRACRQCTASPRFPAGNQRAASTLRRIAFEAPRVDCLPLKTRLGRVAWRGFVKRLTTCLTFRRASVGHDTRTTCPCATGSRVCRGTVALPAWPAWRSHVRTSRLRLRSQRRGAVCVCPGRRRPRQPRSRISGSRRS